MIKCALDIRLIIGFLLAHLLMFFTFMERAVFWHFFAASLLFLICFVVAKDRLDDKLSFVKYFFIGTLSGALLYFLFWMGFQVIKIFHLPLLKQVILLYKYYAPDLLWHYLVLILIAVPGEEIFWRGFIQKRIMSFVSNGKSILISSFMYASVHLYSNQPMLAFAALVGGFFWGWLYAWRRSIPLVIISHLVFDLFLFVFMPFR